MGNGSQNWGINIPAAVNNIIEVGVLHNNGLSATIINDNINNRYNYATNRTSKSNFPNQTFFFALGVSIDFSVVDYSTNRAIESISGTSMATPHVSGLYAVVKSGSPTYTVDQVTTWINQNFSYTVYINAYQAEHFVDCINNEAFKAIGYPRP